MLVNSCFGKVACLHFKYSFVPYDILLSFDLPFWLLWSWFYNTRLKSTSTRTHLQLYYILEMEGEKKRQPETLIYTFNSIYTFNQVQRFNLITYWQTLRPLQNLNSIFHTVKTEPRVSRITSPNKNLACEKAIIVILVLQVARFSAHGNIWGESGRGLPGIWYYYQCQTPSWPITGSRCSRAGTFPREKNACAQALIMGPSHRLTRTTTAFSLWPHDNMMVLKL